MFFIDYFATTIESNRSFHGRLMSKDVVYFCEKTPGMPLGQAKQLTDKLNSPKQNAVLRFESWKYRQCGLSLPK
jgi:hypothetical protein